jgi:hypothetical protein
MPKYKGCKKATVFASPKSVERSVGQQVALGAAALIPIALVASVVLGSAAATQKRRNTDPHEPAGVQTRETSSRHTEILAQAKDKSDLDRLHDGVRKWHGEGKEGCSIRSCSGPGLIARNTLSSCLERAKNSYNEEQQNSSRFSTKKQPKVIQDIKELRKVPISTVLRLCTLADMGRGDAITEDEIQRIKTLYNQKWGMNPKNAPLSTGIANAKEDDFAACVNEVFEITRKGFAGKKVVESFSNATLKKWATLCDVSFSSLVSAGDYRSSALSNWRNMISNLAVWLGVLGAGERKVPYAFIFNADDTTIFLDQKKKNVKTLVPNSAKKRFRNMGLSFSLDVHRKNRIKNRNLKNFSHKQRTIKLLCVTAGSGDLVCTVIQISDRDIKEQSFMCLTKGVYMMLLPKSGMQDATTPKIKYVTQMYRDAVLRCCADFMDEKIANTHAHVEMIDELGQQTFSQSSSVDEEHVPIRGDRGVLCFDGDYPQIEALLSNENVNSAGKTLRQCFADKNIELVKFSGGCSMSQQPNDRSRCFFCIKAAKKKFVFHDIERIRVTANGWALNAVRKLKHHKIEASSLRTFEWFLLTWPDLSAAAFTPGNIKSGWEKVGLCPFVPEKMMEAWAFLPDFLDKVPDGVQQIMELITDCAKIVVETGALSDEDMDAIYYDNEGLFAFVEHSEPESKKTGESAPVNHRRCIWMSNPAWMIAEQQRREQRAEEKRKKEEEAAEKQRKACCTATTSRYTIYF